MDDMTTFAGRVFTALDTHLRVGGLIHWLRTTHPAT